MCPGVAQLSPCTEAWGRDRMCRNETGERMSQAHERVAREDMVLFINACFAASGQAEFYGDGRAQGLSIRFLHEYILGNYRRLYARTLAAGINHFNQALMITNLLAEAAPQDPVAKAEEGALLRAALRELPAPRAYRALLGLRTRQINHRRAKAVTREYIEGRPSPDFDALKYRSPLRALASHWHLSFPGERGRFVFRGAKGGPYLSPLFHAFARAQHDPEAVYELPYSIADGLAAKHAIPRDEFLRRIEPRLTQAERARLLSAREEATEEAPSEAALSSMPLTRLALYALSLPLLAREERLTALDDALQRAARRAARGAAPLGRVALVLDRSESMSGSHERRRRPFAVCLAARYLLRALSASLSVHWSPALPDEHPLLVRAQGQSDLATPLVEALAQKPSLVLIVSDGVENDPPGAANEVARLFHRRIDPSHQTSIIHLNPVFDSERYAPRGLGPAIPTVGIRDAEDIPTMLMFARFADGAAPLAELERYLASCTERLLARHAAPHAEEPQPKTPSPAPGAPE